MGICKFIIPQMDKHFKEVLSVHKNLLYPSSFRADGQEFPKCVTILQINIQFNGCNLECANICNTFPLICQKAWIFQMYNNTVNDIYFMVVLLCTNIFSSLSLNNQRTWDFPKRINRSKQFGVIHAFEIGSLRYRT
jgi:hypothetical protein